jgi:flagellar export protein FliJ
MAKFVFRVQAALDLRRRQEDEARHALALAEAGKRDAEHRRDEVRHAMEETWARGRAVEERAGDVTLRVWYRHWIAAQRLELARREQVVVQRDAEVRDAVRQAQDAHRRRRMLERLRERAHAAFVDGERRDEQKVFDDLGSLRFSINKRGGLS